MPRKTKTSRKKQAEKTGAKAEFIRKHPDLSVRDLVAAAQKAGITISRPQVYGVRKAVQAKLKKSAAKQTAASAQQQKSVSRGAPAAAAAAAAGKGRANKSEFIRSQPPEMSAKQVVAAAAKLGMKISAAYVSNIRSHAKVRQRTGGGESRRLPQVAAAAGATVSVGDAEFRQLVLQLGVPRANELVAEVAAKLAAIIHGQ